MTEIAIIILKYCIKNPAFFLKIKDYLFTKGKKSYFDKNIHQTLFNYLCVYTDKYKELPNKHTILDSLLNKIKDPDIKDDFFININTIFDEELEIGEDYAKDKIIEFIKKAHAHELLMTVGDDIENCNYGSIIKGFTEIDNINFSSDLGTNLDDSTEIFSLLEDIKEENSISTGYQKLDRVINGGWKNKELYVLAAIPGAGKSLFLGSYALNCYLEGKSVLFYTLEISKQQFFTRILSNIFSDNKQNILLYSEDELKEKIENFKTPGKFFTKEYGAHEVSTNDLLSNMDELKKVHNFVPDIVVVDYLLLLKTNDKRMNKDNTYNYYKTVSEELRNIAKYNNCPVITATQLNRNSMAENGGSVGLTSSKDLAESKGILDSADFLATLINTRSDQRNETIRLRVDKNRNGAMGEVIDYKVNYDYMRLTESVT